MNSADIKSASKKKNFWDPICLLSLISFCRCAHPSNINETIFVFSNEHMYETLAHLLYKAAAATNLKNKHYARQRISRAQADVTKPRYRTPLNEFAHSQ